MIDGDDDINTLKILKPTAYYEPEQFSSRHLDSDIERAFVEAGFEYIIIAPTPSRGLSDEIKQAYSKRLYEEKFDGRVKVHRIPIVDEKSNVLSRAFRYVLVCVKQYFYCIREHDVDVVYAASTPPIQGVLAAKVAKKLHAALVYNLQDVFPDSLVTTGMATKNSLIWKVGRMIENYIYKNADRIIVISNTIKENIKAKGVAEVKIEVIPNWIDTDIVMPIEKDSNTLFNELALRRDQYYVVYAGNLGMAQDIVSIIKAAELLHNNKDIVFLIFGDGEEKRMIEGMATRLENVRLFPLMPPNRVSEVYSLGNACIVSGRKGTGSTGVPSKTWSIMACGRAVLTLYDIDSELSSIICDNRIGLCADAGDAEKLAENIVRLYSNKDGANQFGKNAHEYVATRHSRERATQRYIDLMVEAARKGVEDRA